MVVFFLLEAFGLPATIPTAALMMVLCGASTLVPLTPGGAQAGITAVNGALGLGAAMVAFRTLHPVAALRSGVRLARAA